MVGSPEGVSEDNGSITSNRGIVEAFLNPGTFPHVVLLIAISGLLYSVMQLGIFGMDEIGSVIFLSLSISYIISAIFIQTNVGNFLLTVNDDGNGIINISYWRKSSKALITIGIFTTVISFLILNRIQVSSIVMFMGILFIFMSFGQALSIVSGGVNYYNSKRELEIKSRIGMLATFFRMISVLLIFGPLIWWMEVGSQDSSANLSLGIKIIVLLSLSLVAILFDKITESIRIKDTFDGKILDRFLLVMIITTCWHIFSALRRTPIFLDPSESAVIAEEGLLMSISIVLTVWSISNRGAKRGWKIFQSQSAIFWGISFGYAYAGSVASVSSLSEGKLDLISITAIGHVVTSLSIIIMIPFAIKSFKRMSNTQEKIETIIPDDVDNNDKIIGNSKHKDVVTKNNEYSNEINKINEGSANEDINNSENNNFDEVELID